MILELSQHNITVKNREYDLNYYISQRDGFRFPLDYIQRFIGAWYEWGGDDPAGFDCSGLAVEFLKSAGLLKESEDFTADGLYNKFKAFLVNVSPDCLLVPLPGMLIFPVRKNQSKFSHVSIALSEKYMIEAGGGDSSVDTVADAESKNAFVKVRPVSKFSKFVLIDPFFPVVFGE